MGNYFHRHHGTYIRHRVENSTSLFWISTHTKKGKQKNLPAQPPRIGETGRKYRNHTENLDYTKKKRDFNKEGTLNICKILSPTHITKITILPKYNL